MPLVYQLLPDLRQEQNQLQHTFGVADVIGTLLTLPLIIIGVVWQFTRTNWEPILDAWWLVFILFALNLLFGSRRFRIQMGVINGNIIYSESSFSVLMVMTAVLLFGPTIFWIEGLVNLVAFAVTIWRVQNRFVIWSQLRNMVQQLAIVFLGGNIGLSVYEALNGRYPFQGFTTEALTAAFVASLLLAIIPVLILYGYILIAQWVAHQNQVHELMAMEHEFRLRGLIGIVLPTGIGLFGILAAGLYVTMGLGVFLFFMLAVTGAALLAHQLSRSSAQMQQRSREMAQLEQMSQAILNSPIDTAVLPTILQQYIPNMLPGLRLRIWLLPNQILLERSIQPLPSMTAVAPLLSPNQPTPLDDLLSPRDRDGQLQKGFVVPILSEDKELLGGILVIATGDTFTVPALDNYLPSLQALAGQIAAALHRVEMFKQSVASEKMARELEIAGQIQATFLPDAVPQLPGWQLSATIEPARQTSGDFYDFVALEDGRLAIIVADVADKGTGAALYMALSRTLIRTYATQYPDQPEIVLQLANERILQDTKSDQFVTVFFCVLDGKSGQIIYSNAGHNPAFLFRKDGKLESLSNTGVPLGMFEGLTWESRCLSLNSGELLVIYTDGVTEAPNSEDEEFGEERLKAIVRREMENGRLSATTVQDAILHAIHDFVGDTPPFDDITQLILIRN